MNGTAQLILQLIPIVADLQSKDANENQIITKLVRFAERQVIGTGVGGDRLQLVFSIIRQLRPAMLATAEKVEMVERKIRVIVVTLKDLDDDNEGLDDYVADKLEAVADAVDGLGNWFQDAADWFKRKLYADEKDGTQEIFVDTNA